MGRLEVNLLEALVVLSCLDIASCDPQSADLLKRITSRRACARCIVSQDDRPVSDEMQVEKTLSRSKRGSDNDQAIKDPLYVTPDVRVYLQKDQTHHIPCPSQREGEHVSLVLWLSNGEDLLARFTVVPGDTNYTVSDHYGLSDTHGLIIKQVKKNDSGSYACIVVPTSTAVGRKRSVTVTVLDRLFPTVDDIAVSGKESRNLTFGKQLQLDCPASVPSEIVHTATIYWTIDIGNPDYTSIIGVRYSDGKTMVTADYHSEYNITNDGRLIISSLDDNYHRFWCHLSVIGPESWSGYINVTVQDTVPSKTEDPTTDPGQQSNNVAPVGFFIILAVLAVPALLVSCLLFRWKKMRATYLRSNDPERDAECCREEQTQPLKPADDNEDSSLLLKDVPIAVKASSDSDQSRDPTQSSSSTKNRNVQPIVYTFVDAGDIVIVNRRTKLPTKKKTSRLKLPRVIAKKTRKIPAAFQRKRAAVQTKCDDIESAATEEPRSATQECEPSQEMKMIPEPKTEIVIANCDEETAMLDSSVTEKEEIADDNQGSKVSQGLVPDEGSNRCEQKQNTDETSLHESVAEQPPIENVTTEKEDNTKVQLEEEVSKTPTEQKPALVTEDATNTASTQPSVKTTTEKVDITHQIQDKPSPMKDKKKKTNKRSPAKTAKQKTPSNTKHTGSRGQASKAQRSQPELLQQLEDKDTATEAASEMHDTNIDRLPQEQEPLRPTPQTSRLDPADIASRVTSPPAGHITRKDGRDGGDKNTPSTSHHVPKKKKRYSPYNLFSKLKNGKASQLGNDGHGSTSPHNHSSFSNSDASPIPLDALPPVQYVVTQSTADVQPIVPSHSFAPNASFAANPSPTDILPKPHMFQEASTPHNSSLGVSEASRTQHLDTPTNSEQSQIPSKLATSDDEEMESTSDISNKDVEMEESPKAGIETEETMDIESDDTIQRPAMTREPRQSRMMQNLKSLNPHKQEDIRKKRFMVDPKVSV